MKVIKWLDKHLEEALLVILLVVIACISMIQVIVRKLPFIPALTWAEEFCRFCWIASVFLSLPYTLRMGTMLRVTALLDILPELLRKSINLAVYVVTTLSMGLLAFYSEGVVKEIVASGETSPAMLWPMWVVYSVMIVGFVLGTLRGVQQIVIHAKMFSGHEMTTAEMAMQDAKQETDNAREDNA
ncbi:MAG: TRAP transporter small permease [Lachnospiraceae bacterium]|nr:TRAP transporter small permease [Candidatus Equihabitans merdae]